MTLRQALGHAREILATQNTEDVPLEAELLLRHALGISRVQLYLDLDHELSPDQEGLFYDLVERRSNHEPIAYILGHREFYGLDFYVDPSVFIPRPESELLVEKALDKAKDHGVSTITEVGTGSGAIAVSLALNLPQAVVYATDISAPALKVARLNCQKHGVADRIRLLLGDALNPLPGPVDLIVANLPYVKESEIGAKNFEPRLALDGGMDGLEQIRQLCHQVGSKLRPGGYLLVEIGMGQESPVTTLLRELFSSAEIGAAPDLSGINRVVSLALP